jgi:hypothetical protein
LTAGGGALGGLTAGGCPPVVFGGLPVGGGPAGLSGCWTVCGSAAEVLLLKFASPA